MNQFKLFILPVIGFILSIVVPSCNGDDGVDPSQEMVPANAKGICVSYLDGLKHKTFYAYISRDIIKSTSSLSEYNKVIVEANYLNLRYYTLTMVNVEELILDNFSWLGIMSINDSPETKALYNYVSEVKTQYTYVATNGSVIWLFNRTSDINY